ncbi:hypothetical protein GGR53DRAFT_480504 [Hypoxylon sp. FL1150]|nr:hypothetical protein GGR53DRAFT_480504 [Hypoxylon sp. FL1150]
MFPRGLPPIGIGIDICQIHRVRKILASPVKATKFAQRILSPEELSMPVTSRILKCVFTPSETSTRIEDPTARKAADFMAGRFAAKEAVIKAYSRRRLTFHDIVVTYQNELSTPFENETLKSSRREQASASASEGQPDERSSASPPVAIIKGDGIYGQVYARLSISHDGDYATAMCLTMLEDPGYRDGAGDPTTGLVT